MADTYIFTYNIAVATDAGAETDGIFTITTTTNPSGGPYTITGITGSFDGQAITTMDGATPPGAPYPTPDNVAGTSAGFFDGIDGAGISFDTAGTSTVGAERVDLFNRNGSIIVTVTSAMGAVITKRLGSVVSYSTTAPACFLRGTRIATPGGEVAVEALAAGDIILTAAGATRLVKWVGHRSYAAALALANPAIVPVRFNAGSLGGGLPVRDLRVSPKHAMFIDGYLVPADELVNGVTINRALPQGDVHYHHVELDSHDVILAEGAPSETFVDDDNRNIFHNVGEFEAMYPGEARVPALYCAPRLAAGETLRSIKNRLAELVITKAAA